MIIIILIIIIIIIIIRPSEAIKPLGLSGCSSCPFE